MRHAHLLVALSLALPAAVLAQAGASADITDIFSHCAGPVSRNAPPDSTTSLVQIAERNGAACSLRASGYGYAGVVGATAHAQNLQGYFNGATVGVAFASGNWTDNVTATWPTRFAVVGVDRLRLNFHVGATGGVSATRQAHPSNDEAYIALGNATIDYLFHVAGRQFSGRQQITGGGGLSSTGTWGTISGSVDLPALSLGAGQYAFDAIRISLSGSARAAVEALSGLASADAEFGSTLQWQGIASVQAFDAGGQEIALPSGFQLGLAGGQTGLDYWDAAPKLPVPEPGSWALLAAGLVAVLARWGWWHRVGIASGRAPAASRH